jgi:hypothetical protein
VCPARPARSDRDLIRVRVEIMGPGKYESVGESQSVSGAHAEASGGAPSTVSAGALVQMP